MVTDKNNLDEFLTFVNTCFMKRYKLLTQSISSEDIHTNTKIYTPGIYYLANI